MVHPKQYEKLKENILFLVEKAKSGRGYLQLEELKEICRYTTPSDIQDCILDAVIELDKEGKIVAKFGMADYKLLLKPKADS